MKISGCTVIGAGFVLLLGAPACMGGPEGAPASPRPLDSPTFGPAELVAAGRDEPRGIAVSDGFVYWVERGKIAAADSTGTGTPVELATVAPPEQMERIAVSGGFVYATNASDSNGQVLRITLGSGAIEVLHQGANMIPWRIVVDGSSAVYYSTQSGGGGVWKIDPASTTPVKIVDFVFANALAVDGLDNVFVATNGGQIGVLEPEFSLLRDEGRAIGGIAVHDGVVFYTVEGTSPTFTDGEIRSFVPGDVTAVTLATGLHRPGSIVVNDGGVWVAAAGPGEANGSLVRGAGTIWWLPHAGGMPPRAVAEGQDHPTALAVDAEGVYWTNLLGGTVMRATRVSP